MTQVGAGAVATDLTALSNDEKVEILRSRMAHLVSVPDYSQAKESDSLPYSAERRSHPEGKESFERSMLEVLSAGSTGGADIAGWSSSWRGNVDRGLFDGAGAHHCPGDRCGKTRCCYRTERPFVGCGLRCGR